MANRSHVVVVGAGAGGLAAAVALGTAGLRVTVVEQAAEPGGKIATTDVAGRAVEAGPTVLTMPWVFDELFAAAGQSFRERVTLTSCDVLARHAWPDGTRLDLFQDPERSADAIATVFGRGEADAFRAFAAQARATYEVVEGPFLRSQRPTPADLLRHAGVLGLSALTRIDGLRTMWTSLSGRFRDPRLQQLFGRYATYCGSSPFEAPATLNLVSHVESLGVYQARGGMRAVANAMAELAVERGACIRYGVKVEQILADQGRAAGVRLAGGEVIHADAVLWNGDAAAVRSVAAPWRRKLPEPLPFAARSLSAFTMALVAESSGFPLAFHNVFFSSDYGAEFRSMQERRRVPDEPTVYICASDRGEGEAEPSGGERMLVVVNAPATGDDPAAWSERERQRCKQAAFSVMQACGLELAVRAERTRTPVDFDLRFPGTGGALYGPKAKGALSALSRTPARSDVPRLYFAGGTVHPGPGVPMAALSGRLAAEAIVADLGSTQPSPRAGTSGITSTA